MAVTDEKLHQELRRRYLDGESPAQLLRFLHSRDPDWSTSYSIDAMYHAFNLGSDINHLGGWWPDGSGPLSDSRLNALLRPTIERERAYWEPLLKQRDDK
ncbi:MAG TPA: hypothetical protein VNG33_20645 [Polyangiaceae bacterium]|nr:hypothetical protein [Polyangiaceae bacterium]